MRNLVVFLAAGLVLADEDAVAAVESCGAMIRHFHASEPFLAPLYPGSSTVDHLAIANMLRIQRYSGWVSMEMRAAEATLEK